MRTHEQRLKIVSDPPGAQIVAHDQVLGTTPSFVSLRRAEEAQILLHKPGYEEKSAGLPTSYRWADSFVSNFVWFLWGAPVGWITDLATGTAWDYDTVPVLELKPVQGKKDSHPEDKMAGGIVVIAPPHEEHEPLSDELAAKIESLARQHFKDKRILPFEKTRDVFAQYGYTNTDRPLPRKEEELFDQLQVTHVLTTQAVQEGGGVRTSSDLVNIFTAQAEDHFEVFHPLTKLQAERRTSWLKRAYSLISIVPNALSFDPSLSGTKVLVHDDPNTDLYEGLTVQNTGVTHYLLGLGLRNVKSPKLIQNFHGSVRLVTDVELVRDRIQFNGHGTNSITGNDYDWYTLSVGFGPEFMLETVGGSIYLDLLPAAQGNYLKGGGYDAGRANLGFVFEIGYLVFVSERVHLRLFSRKVSMSSDQWDQAIAPTGLKTNPGPVEHFSAGISIGYYFPEAKSLIKNAVY